MMAAAWREDASIDAERHVIYRLARELGVPEKDAEEYAARATDEYTQAYTNSGPSRQWPAFDDDSSSDAVTALGRYRKKATDCLINMRLDDPVRQSFVKLVGFDPNDKWVQPIGDFSSSQALSAILKIRKVEPDFDF